MKEKNEDIYYASRSSEEKSLQMKPENSWQIYCKLQEKVHLTQRAASAQILSLLEGPSPCLERIKILANFTSCTTEPSHAL